MLHPGPSGALCFKNRRINQYTNPSVGSCDSPGQSQASIIIPAYGNRRVIDFNKDGAEWLLDGRRMESRMCHRE